MCANVCACACVFESLKPWCSMIVIANCVTDSAMVLSLTRRGMSGSVLADALTKRFAMAGDITIDAGAKLRIYIQSVRPHSKNGGRVDGQTAASAHDELPSNAHTLAANGTSVSSSPSGMALLGLVEMWRPMLCNAGGSRSSSKISMHSPSQDTYLRLQTYDVVPAWVRNHCKERS